MLASYVSLPLLVSGVLMAHNKVADFKFQQNDFKMEFERADVVHYNKRLVKQFEIHTFKYNRTCAVVNMTYEYKIDVGNDIQIITQAYMFLSNEYRLFPIRLEVNFCEAVSKNYIGAGRMTKCGNFTGCPIKKGTRYHNCNFSPDESQYPPFIPNGRYMLEFQGLYHDEELFLAQGYGRVYRPIVIL